MDEDRTNNGVYANIQPQKVPFLWKDKEYTFMVKELTWSQKNKINSKCLVGRKDTASVDIDLYNREVLKASVIDADGLFNASDNMEYLKFSNEFGEALEQQIIPNIGASSISEEEEKN